MSEGLVLRVERVEAPPMLGDRVIYTRAQGDEYAAIIVKVVDDKRVQLAVFMPVVARLPEGGGIATGSPDVFESKTWYSRWVGFDAHGAQNTWRWRPDGSR